jgi:mannose-6-phosphate isomerase-like protein (cupin superfamily)
LPCTLAEAKIHKRKCAKAGIEKAVKVSDAEVGEALSTEARSWGTVSVVDEGWGFQVKRVEIQPTEGGGTHRHARQFAHWRVVGGVATVMIYGKERELVVGDGVDIPHGVAHRIENRTSKPVMIIEIQMGESVGTGALKCRGDSCGCANTTGAEIV